MTAAVASETTNLPMELREFFWEYDFEKLSWEKDRDMIVGRLLSSGNWNSIKWLRSVAGKDGLRQWIITHEGRGLSSPQMCFWELILHLPPDLVEKRIQDNKRSVWENRFV